MHRGTLGSDVMRSHVSGGFTLDEAARVFRTSSPGRLMACPSCGGPMPWGPQGAVRATIVLWIDDDSLLIGACAPVLERHGYRVPSKDYVFKVKMTYKSLDVTVWQLLSVVASTRDEAVEKAHKRWSDWQQDIKQYQVLYKWDYESAKTIAILDRYC